MEQRYYSLKLSWVRYLECLLPYDEPQMGLWA